MSTKKPKGASGHRARGKKSDAELAARFLMARCDREVESNTARDLGILRSTFRFSMMPDEHPLRMLWLSPTSRSRFALHHLADDLHELRGVPGFDRLLRRLVEDPDAFEDYRYELRLAAALARPKTQTLLNLAAERPGPDIEFVSSSGHRCGIACYRANSATPAITTVSRTCQEVARAFLQAFTALPIPVDLGVEIEFPRFPPSELQIEDAKNILVKLWLAPEAEPEEAGQSGVVVRRAVVLKVARSPGMIRRCRLRFMFPVPDREGFRIERHLVQKLEKEDRAWGRDYEGQRMLAVEESDFSHGMERQGAKALLERAGSTFLGLLVTQLLYTPQGRVVHGFERVRDFFDNTDLRLDLQTFGQNDRSWADGAMTLSHNATHASEMWDVWQSAGAVHASRIGPLEITKQFSRIEMPQGSSRPMDDPAFRAKVERVMEQQRAQMQLIFDS